MGNCCGTDGDIAPSSKGIKTEKRTESNASMAEQEAEAERKQAAEMEAAMMGFKKSTNDCKGDYRETDTSGLMIHDEKKTDDKAEKTKA
jgi:hypothetical protein